jgi:hypothetical protein
MKQRFLRKYPLIKNVKRGKAMENNSFVRKVIAIILLCIIISVTFTSSTIISAAPVSNEENLIEVTTQIIGMNEMKDTTVFLTKEQYQHLEHYLREFRAKLNQTSKKEAAYILFEEAVRELKKYNMVPHEMSTEHINDLFVLNSKDTLSIPILQRMNRISDYLNHTNMFCLIAGETTRNTRFFGFLEMACSGLCWTLYYSSRIAHIDDPVLLNKSLNFVKSIRNLIYTINAKRITGAGIIAFGNSHSSCIPPPYQYYPAAGWITTLGVLGKKSWNGTFFGRLLLMAPYDTDSYTFYPGAFGFVGIKVNLRATGTFFFLGSSLLVSVK